MAVSMKIVTGNISFGRDGDRAELRDVGSGDNATKVVNFSVATPQRRREGSEWVDGETLWTNCEAWGRLAENIAKSFKRGDLFIGFGVEKADSFTHKDSGEKVVRTKVRIDECGPNIFFDPATSSRELSSGKGAGPSKSAPKKSAPKQSADDDFNFDEVESSDDDNVPPF